MNKLMDEARIKMLGKRIDFLEFGGSNYFAVLHSGDDIPNYCETVLTNEICYKLLPMKFVRTVEGLYLHYDYSGFVQLKDIASYWRQDGKNISIEMIELLIWVIRSIMVIENYLFKTDGYRLKADTIFINPETYMIKMAYIPEDTEGLLSQRLISLIGEQGSLWDDDQWNYYSKEIVEKILLPEDSLAVIERKLVKKAREISGKGWPAKEMLRV